MEILKIDVQTQPKSYEICIGYNFIDEIVQTIKNRRYGSRYAIITDTTVRPLHGDLLCQAIKKQNLAVDVFEMPAGEANKTRTTKDWLDDQLLNNKYGRDSVIISLGGGVVGDVAGFVASTYMRGIPCIQIPTTTIAQGDSSIGGKTAIDMPQGKNLIGAFFHPQIVFIDVQMLQTLDERNYNSGLIEIVKHGFIRNAEFLSFFNDNLDVILARDSSRYPEVMVQLMKANCAIKNDVVQADEKEQDLRKILNYGHTVGHAVEFLSNYSLLHGEAVAIGIACEAFFSYRLGYCSYADFVWQVEMIKKLKLPSQIPQNMEIDAIISAMCMDKKARDSEPEFVLLESLGKTKVFDHGKNAIKINRNTLGALIDEFIKSKGNF